MVSRITYARNEADYRAGIVASLIANSNRGEHTAPFHPHDFFPALKPETKPQTAEDHAAIVRQFAAQFGGELSTKYTRGEA